MNEALMKKLMVKMFSRFQRVKELERTIETLESMYEGVTDNDDGLALRIAIKLAKNEIEVIQNDCGML